MPSTFAWLDFSEHQHRHMLDLLDLFRERDTRDELGTGVIRDAFADLLFPGTGTVQTRARYFLFIPWLYKALEAKQTPSSRFESQSRRDELALIPVLIAQEGSDGRVIGYRARDRLKRLPSNIYWLGLQQWGICRFGDNQAAYYASLDGYYTRQRSLVHDNDGDRVSQFESHWHPDLPLPPVEFPTQADFRLTRAEASFLADRITLNHPTSLLAAWVQERPVADVDFAWQHPGVEALPFALQEQLYHAKNFSIVMHGAPLLYNLMLSEKRGDEDWIAHYRDDLRNWSEAMAGSQPALQHWNRDTFWQIAWRVNPRIFQPTRLFVNKWLDIALAHSKDIANVPAARTLIDHREMAIKGGQARLHNPAALKAYTGAAGIGQMSFRWRNAQTLLRDILGALHDA